MQPSEPAQASELSHSVSTTSKTLALLFTGSTGSLPTLPCHLLWGRPVCFSIVAEASGKKRMKFDKEAIPTAQVQAYLLFNSLVKAHHTLS